MPLTYLIFMIVIVILAAGFTVWLGYGAGLMVAGPVLIGAMVLRLWLARR